MYEKLRKAGALLGLLVAIKSFLFQRMGWQESFLGLNSVTGYFWLDVLMAFFIGYWVVMVWYAVKGRIGVAFAGWILIGASGIFFVASKLVATFVQTGTYSRLLAGAFVFSQAFLIWVFWTPPPEETN